MKAPIASVDNCTTACQYMDRPKSIWSGAVGTTAAFIAVKRVAGGVNSDNCFGAEPISIDVRVDDISDEIPTRLLATTAGRSARLSR